MMKKFFVLLLCAMSTMTVLAQYNCTVVTSDKETVTFRVTGYGKKAKLASADAELSAVKALCFVGAAGTAFRLPLISQEQSKAEKEHADFFEEFYNTSYRNFIETSTIVSPFGKDAAKRKSLTMDVRVRAVQLRAYLEKSGVIRKFGL